MLRERFAQIEVKLGLALAVLGGIILALWLASRGSDPHGGFYSLVVGAPIIAVGLALCACGLALRAGARAGLIAHVASMGLAFLAAIQVDRLFGG